LQVRSQLAAVTAQVADGPGWTRESAAPNDRPWADVQLLYADALEAWRNNLPAKRIVDITGDYVVADGIRLDGPGPVGRFLRRWWNHPENRMDLRLPDPVDELTRAGDLFASLHRNPQDGQSYLRLVPKDRINRIETAPNDWVTELAYEERTDAAGARSWLAADHRDAPRQAAVMVHYAVNGPVGALLGESDLAPLLPWMRR
jgi:hypothetical protein